MAETRYCYACHLSKGKDVKTDFNPNRGPYGNYTCPECGHSVDKKVSGDTGEKYI